MSFKDNANQKKNGRLRDWLTLLRVPNLFTVPGDPLAGFLLASRVTGHAGIFKVFPAIGASLLLYAAGLIWNDCVDLREDQHSRPDRPLASGAIKLRSAVSAGNLFLVAGLFCAAPAGMAALNIALLLLILILLYNFGTKNIPVVGALNMGLCRGTSLMLGAACTSHPYQWPPSVFMASCVLILYIGFVTYLAHRETQPDSSINPDTIGALLRGLLLLQSALCATVPGKGYIAALILLLLWLPCRYLGKRFYAS